MPSRVQKAKTAPQEKKVEQVEPQQADADEIIEATDKMLDEIDELLDDIVGESSAQDFVASYKQKGGE